MADGDSTNDVGSDVEVDTSAADADVEDEELLADGWMTFFYAFCQSWLFCFSKVGWSQLYWAWLEGLAEF